MRAAVFTEPNNPISIQEVEIERGRKSTRIGDEKVKKNGGREGKFLVQPAQSRWSKHKN